MKKLWAKDGVLWSAEDTYVGHRAIEQAAAGLLRRYPEYDFARFGEVDEIADVARLRWVFGAVGNPPGITGMDIITASDGRIVSMYRFLDGEGM